MKNYRMTAEEARDLMDVMIHAGKLLEEHGHPLVQEEPAALGRALKAALAYLFEEEVPVLEPNAMELFEIMKNDIDMEKREFPEEYAEFRIKNSLC